MSSRGILERLRKQGVAYKRERLTREAAGFERSSALLRNRLKSLSDLHARIIHPPVIPNVERGSSWCRFGALSSHLAEDVSTKFKAVVTPRHENNIVVKLFCFI